MSDSVTTVLGCRIDFVAAQDNATQAPLTRIEGKIDDLQKTPFVSGWPPYTNRRQENQRQPVKKERIQRALDAFTQASEYSHISNPLIPLKANFSAEACYDLLNEGAAALDNYEEVFQEAKEFEKIAQRGYILLPKI